MLLLIISIGMISLTVAIHTLGVAFGLNAWVNAWNITQV